MAEPSSPPPIANPTREAAERNLETLLNGALYIHGATDAQGRPTHPQHLTAKVKIGTGLGADQYLSPHEKQKEVLRVTIEDSHAENPASARDQALSVLSKIPALADAVEFKTPEEQAEFVKGLLKKAGVPENYSQWRGISAALEKDAHIEDHAIQSIVSNKFGISFDLNVPRVKTDDASAVTSTQKVENNLKARLGEIKAALKTAVCKYLPGNQKAVEAVDRLEITLNRTEYEYGNNVSVTILSPEQKPFAGLLGPQRDVAKTPEGLNETNPLALLSPEQRGKALGRAFLHAGETAKEIFPIVAGREDMKRALEDCRDEIAKTSPEKAEFITQALKSEMFKPHNWREREGLKENPIVSKDPDKPGIMTIDFTLPAGRAQSIIEYIAALDKPKDKSLEFANVESVKLVGGNLPLPQVKELQALLKPEVAAPQALPEDALVPLATRIIANIEETHRLIEQGIKMATQSTPLPVVAAPRITPAQAPGVPTPC